LDGHPRRRKLLSHDRVAKSFPGGTVGIGGNPAVPIAPRSGPEPPKSTARDLMRVRFQSCGGRECRMAPPAKPAPPSDHIPLRRRCALGVDSIPSDPVLLAAKVGAVGGGRALMGTLRQGFPPQWRG
jgi:hypothetical protein